MLNKLKQSPVGQYIQTLTELHIDYLGKKIWISLPSQLSHTLSPAIESQVFNLGREKSIYSLYNPETPSHQDLELDQIARQVSTVFSSLGERPLIRFYDPNQVVENHGGSLKSLCAASASSSSSSSMSSLKSSSSYAYSSRGSSSSSSSVKLPISAKFANLLQQHIDKLSQNDPAFPSSTSAPTSKAEKERQTIFTSKKFT